MELNELNDSERLALVALIEIALESDAQVSDLELEKLDAVTKAIGDDIYEETADAVDQRFEDEDALRAFLPSITRQDARELIYTTVLDAAITDTVNTHEGDLLNWLAQIWNISIRTDNSETPT